MMAEEFVPVLKLADVPATGMIVVDVKGVRIAIAQVDGAYYAFDDECTHEQCSLARDRVAASPTRMIASSLLAMRPMHRTSARPFRRVICEGASRSESSWSALQRSTPITGLRRCSDRESPAFANHYHPVFGRRIRVEHWQNAQRQGLNAARNMAGQRVAFDDTPWFWSDQSGARCH
jgi:hypothetical protein